MITGGEGEVGKKIQELTAGSGVAGIEAGRCGDGGSTENRTGAARSRGGGGVPVAGVQEGDEEVARKLPRVDVVLVVSLVRAERGRNVWMTVKPSGGSGQDCRRGVLCGVSVRGWRRTGQGASVGSTGLRTWGGGVD
jgi:hypothetical protein